MPASHKPWPMKWIVLGIVAFAIPYTYVRIHYSKPGPAYNAYGDTKAHATNGRLLSAGYQRIAMGSERPAEPSRTAAALAAHATVLPAPGGLPADLDQALLDKPVLPLSVDSVAAAPSIPASQGYAVQFTCTLADKKQQISAALLYRRDDQLVIVPSFEKLDGSLLARSKDTIVLVTVPPGSLKPGRYTVSILGTQTARTWTLQVN